METNTILQCEGLTRRFQSGSNDICVLNDVTFTISRGETCAVLGPSGSGKTTLLSLAAGLDRPTSGRVVLDGIELNKSSEDELADLRSRSVGFIFQDYLLLPSHTALENVLLPQEIKGTPNKSEAQDLLQKVGLAERMNHYPSQLSGGEQQRVALARAFINRPLIIFADEPTGSLDSESAELALQAMFTLNQEHEVALLLVTHDAELGRRMGRSIVLKAGRVVSDG